MNFNGLAQIRGLILSPARQVSPGKGASCVARFAEHGPAETGRFRPVSMSSLDLQTLEACFVGGSALEARF
jgi:hypothetical protein